MRGDCPPPPSPESQPAPMMPPRLRCVEGVVSSPLVTHWFVKRHHRLLLRPICVAQVLKALDEFVQGSGIAVATSPDLAATDVRLTDAQRVAYMAGRRQQMLGLWRGLTFVMCVGMWHRCAGRRGYPCELPAPLRCPAQRCTGSVCNAP